MKKIIFIVAFLSVCLTCIACDNTKKVEDDSVAMVVNDDVYPIAFDFSNIDTVVYLEEDNVYVIHYNDPDLFDYDNLAYRTNREHWYGNYIAIDIEEEILGQFLNDYTDYDYSNDYSEKEMLNSKYIIIEHDITFQDDTHDIIFYIAIDNVGND